MYTFRSITFFFKIIFLVSFHDCISVIMIQKRYLMDSSTIFQAPPKAAYFLWSCDKVYHKQEVCFLLYFLGQIVSWRYNPKLFGLKLTMYSYKWSWLTVVELIIEPWTYTIYLKCTGKRWLGENIICTWSLWITPRSINPKTRSVCESRENSAYWQFCPLDSQIVVLIIRKSI